MRWGQNTRTLPDPWMVSVVTRRGRAAVCVASNKNTHRSSYPQRAELTKCWSEHEMITTPQIKGSLIMFYYFEVMEKRSLSWHFSLCSAAHEFMFNQLAEFCFMQQHVKARKRTFLWSRFAPFYSQTQSVNQNCSDSHTLKTAGLFWELRVKTEREVVGAEISHAFLHSPAGPDWTSSLGCNEFKNKVV